MKFSHSIIFCAVLGLTSIGLTPKQAKSLTTFADADSTDFIAALDSDAVTYTIDFDGLNPGDQTSLSDGTLNNGVQTLRINSNPNSLFVRGTIFNASPLSNPRQIAFSVADNATSTVTFTLDNPSNYFGINIGDMFDIGGTSTYTLTAGGTDIIDGVSFGSIPASTGTVTFPDTNSLDGTDNLTVGDNQYNFFGIIADSPFSTVTLTLTESGDNVDNLVFDDIIVQGDATPVPFEFSPSLGLISFCLGFISLRYCQARLKNKSLS